MYGYMGAILRVDLTEGEIKKEPLDRDLVEKFIGGRGFGIKLLWDELKPGIDPLSPDNKLIITTGPLAGTKVQSASRWMAQFKSPLTETYFRSVGGGYFGAELRFAGYDGIIVEGKSDEPVYIWIDDGEVELRPAGKVWGMTTESTRRFILRETDERARIAMIGPAGERLVRISAIVTDDMRTASRGGGGAVMGSKNLKAIAVKGNAKPEIYDWDSFNSAFKKQIKLYRDNPGIEGFRKLGTNGAVYPFYLIGHFPTYNFRQTELDGVERFRPESLERYVVDHHGCFGCMIRCGKTFKLEKGIFAGLAWDFPEYETHWAYGGNTGNTNIESITYANMLSDSYGVDTISAGSAIAFLMEIYEKGIVTGSEVGLEPRWGDPEIIVELIRKIALRIGIGDILAEGVRRASEIIGRGSEKYAMHVKGLELPAYDPRSSRGQGLNLATSPIGASHCMGWNKFEIRGIPEKVDPFTVERKAELTKYVQDETAMMETAIFCSFPVVRDMVTVELYSELLYTATGIERFNSPEYLWIVGERIFNLERLFNLREGIDGRYDGVPERISREPIPRDPSRGQIFEEDVLLEDYYRVRGWGKNGIPLPEKLKELDLPHL